MNLNYNVVGVAAIGYLLYLAFKNEAPAEKVVQGTKVVKIEKPSFSSSWKSERNTPTNQFGGRPYGWRGLPAAAYLSN